MIHVNSKKFRSLKGIFTPHKSTNFLRAFSAVPTAMNCYIVVFVVNTKKSNTKGTFNDYVAKKRWVGPKLLIFLSMFRV